MAFSLRLLVEAACWWRVALLWTRGVGFARLRITYDAGWSSQEYSIFLQAARVLTARTCLRVNSDLYILNSGSLTDPPPGGGRRLIVGRPAEDSGHGA